MSEEDKAVTIEIKKGVPIPLSSKRLGVVKYPFAQMAVGDCFSVPASDEKNKRGDNRAVQNLRNSACAHKRRNAPEWEFAIGRDREAKTVTIWRVK